MAMPLLRRDCSRERAVEREVQWGLGGYNNKWVFTSKERRTIETTYHPQNHETQRGKLRKGFTEGKQAHIEKGLWRVEGAAFG